MMHYRLSPTGDPVPEPDLIAWAMWFQTADCSIAKDTVVDPSSGKEIRVSTAFLGIDHGHREGAPVLFETMIFGGSHDEYQERYANRADAEKGHAAAVKLASENPKEQ